MNAFFDGSRLQGSTKSQSKEMKLLTMPSCQPDATPSLQVSQVIEQPKKSLQWSFLYLDTGWKALSGGLCTIEVIVIEPQCLSVWTGFEAAERGDLEVEDIHFHSAYLTEKLLSILYIHERPSWSPMQRCIFACEVRFCRSHSMASDTCIIAVTHLHTI